MNQTESFDQYVRLRYQLFNSMFLTLPYKDVQNTGHYLPLLASTCEEGLKKKLSPPQIIDTFFDDHHVKVSDEKKTELLFKFVQYIERCQVETTFYFMGSNDLSPAEQLKGLYLKQELAKFARTHQGQDAASLQRAFRTFVERVEPFNLTRPSWRPGAASLETAVVGER